MVKADGSWPRGCGFKPRRRILDGCRRIASYYIKEKLKIKVAKWGTPKKYLITTGLLNQTSTFRRGAMAKAWWLRQRTHNWMVVGSISGTVYLMVVSDASFCIWKLSKKNTSTFNNFDHNLNCPRKFSLQLKYRN